MFHLMQYSRTLRKIYEMIPATANSVAQIRNVKKNLELGLKIVFIRQERSIGSY